MNAKGKILVLVFALIGAAFIFRENIKELFDKEDQLEIALRNATPYDVRFSYGLKDGDGELRFDGWVEVSAGATKVLRSAISEKDTEAFFYAESVLNSETMRRASPDEWKDKCVILTKQVEEKESSHLVNLWEDFSFSSLLQSDDEELERVSFDTVGTVSKSRNLRSVSYVVSDDDFDYLNAEVDFSSGLSALEACCNNAAEFAVALENQEEMAERGFRENYPYILARQFSDPNGPRSKGVVIDSAFANSISGQPSPLVEGDIIVAINGHDVFGIGDMAYQVDLHARLFSKGIEELVSVDFIREGEPRNVGMTYFFNPQYFERSSEDSLKASIRGGFESFTAGFDDHIAGYAPKVGNAGKEGFNFLSRKLAEHTEVNLGILEIKEVDTQKIKWRYKQETARLMQLYPQEFGGGQIVGMFVPSPGRITIIKSLKGVGGRSLKGGAGKLATNVAAEVIEGAVWSYNTRGAELTEEQTFEILKNDAKLSAGIGFAVHAIPKIRKKLR